jgi:hypothetical protein
MDNILWYAEASLSADTRIFCAGTLAQCVRRWVRLPQADQMIATIKLGPQTVARKTLAHDEILVLSKKAELYKV